MDDGRALWEKYCNFFDKSFSEQVIYNETLKEAFFEEWKHSKAAKQLCEDGVERFEDIPLTIYDDYPILDEFGQRVEEISQRVPRGKEETLWDYYDRISRQVAPMMDGWLADEYGFCFKTSGTGGKSKWFVQGRQFLENSLRDVTAIFVLICSSDWGKTNLRTGDKILGIGGPPPYVGAIFFKAILENGFKMVPPLDVFENIADMRKKIMVALKIIEKGERIDIAGGIASAFYMACRYFTDRPALYKDYYLSMGFGIPKIVLLFMWLYQSLFGKKYSKAKEIMQVKGLGAGGFDTEIYVDFLKDQFEVEPLNIYGSTECGFVMAGPPDHKRNLMPFLNSCYFEFLDDNGEVRKINELEMNKIYELVATPFRSVIVRYKTGDLFKVVNSRSDGLPILSFESRRTDILDIYGYFRLSGALAVEALVEAGLPPTDKWAFAKEIGSDEHLCLLMERDWEYSEKESSQRIFEALQKISPYFQNYVRDFGIRDPWKIIRVEYLRKGAFMRYTMLKAKEGVEMGQIKPPKLITLKNKSVADLLRRI